MEIILIVSDIPYLLEFSSFNPYHFLWSIKSWQRSRTAVKKYCTFYSSRLRSEQFSQQYWLRSNTATNWLNEYFFTTAEPTFIVVLRHSIDSVEGGRNRTQEWLVPLISRIEEARGAVRCGESTGVLGTCLLCDVLEKKEKKNDLEDIKHFFFSFFFFFYAPRNLMKRRLSQVSQGLCFESDVRNQLKSIRRRAAVLEFRIFGRDFHIHLW